MLATLCANTYLVVNTVARLGDLLTIRRLLIVSCSYLFYIIANRKFDLKMKNHKLGELYNIIPSQIVDKMVYQCRLHLNYGFVFWIHCICLQSAWLLSQLVTQLVTRILLWIAFTWSFWTDVLMPGLIS